MSRTRHLRRPRARRGSILLPLVATMLLLLAAGLALVELSSAQRLRSTVTADSFRAFWVAEAGMWHAALLDAEIAAPVAFSGGSYTVTQTGDDYASAGTVREATRVVRGTFFGGGSSKGPIDVVATAATARPSSFNRIRMQLVTLTDDPYEIESFSLSASGFHPPLRRLRLDRSPIWFGFEWLPMSDEPPNRGSTDDRTIEGGSPPLNLAFWWSPFGSQDYELTLSFADGSSSTIRFTIDW
ncbi:MAG: hypothetical protein AAF682_26410 [Planctomycetota bacterium]